MASDVAGGSAVVGGGDGSVAGRGHHHRETDALGPIPAVGSDHLCGNPPASSAHDGHQDGCPVFDVYPEPDRILRVPRPRSTRSLTRSRRARRPLRDHHGSVGGGSGRRGPGVQPAAASAGTPRASRSDPEPRRGPSLGGTSAAAGRCSRSGASRRQRTGRPASRLVAGRSGHMRSELEAPLLAHAAEQDGPPSRRTTALRALVQTLPEPPPLRSGIRSRECAFPGMT